MSPGIRLYAICLHYIWAVALLISSEPMKVTAVYNIVNSPVGGGSRFLSSGVLFGAATLGLISFHYRPPDARALLCLGPQSLLLALAFAGALTAMLTSTYADGEARGWQFIAADQAPAILAFLIHSVVIIRLFGLGVRRGNEDG